MTITKDIPITIDPDIMSGVPVFTDTRVPVSALLENLGAGVSLDEFLENFPTVKREQAVRVLEHFRAELDDLSLSALVLCPHRPFDRRLLLRRLPYSAFLSFSFSVSGKHAVRTTSIRNTQGQDFAGRRPSVGQIKPLQRQVP